MNQLPRERLAIAVDALAMAEAAVVETLEYTREREAFGKPVLDFQNTRFELAHCKSQVMATRTFVDYCIQREIAGELDAVTAPWPRCRPPTCSTTWWTAASNCSAATAT